VKRVERIVSSGYALTRDPSSCGIGIRGAPAGHLGQVMDPNETRIHTDATAEQAADTISRFQVSDLMVVDGDDPFVSVMSEGKLIRPTMLSCDELPQAAHLSQRRSTFSSRVVDPPIDPLRIRTCGACPQPPRA